MPPGLIVLVIIVGISLLITVTSNWLRNQQRQIEAAAAEKRAKTRSTSGGGSSSPAGRPAAGDIDRFLEEINKLRQKPAAGSTTETATPTRKVEPVKPAKPLVSPAPVARRVEAAPVVSAAVPRFDELPVAPVVARILPSVTKVTPVATTPTQPPSAPPTPLARQFVGLLSNRSSVPLAVILQEVLGPPKCRRQ